MANTQASELIDSARSYADGMVSAAEEAMSDAVGAVGSIFGAPHITLNWASFPDKPEEIGDLKAPELKDITFEPGDGPDGALKFQDIGTIDTNGAPVNTAKLEGEDLLNQNTPPSALSAFNLSSPTLDLLANFPSAPSMILPRDVEIEDREAPTLPEIQRPSFDGVRPQDILPMQEKPVEAMRFAYTSGVVDFVPMANGYVEDILHKMNPKYHEQMWAIELQLEKYLNGGTALKPEIEAAIYNRARARNEFEAWKVQDSVFADTAARGFTLPSGAMASALARARQEAANNDNKTSNEIAIAQAEMEQKNLQFAVTTSASLRTTMVNFTIAYLQNIVTVNGQAVSHANNVANAIIETYNSLVKVYAANLEGYKADASVFQTRMQAATIEIEIYKGEIQALQAMSQVDLARVNVYRARIDALTAQTSMYKAGVEAAVSKASLQKLKVDLFQAQVQAYGAHVSAKTAEWQGYTAQIQGDLAKVQAYSAKVQAYSTEVNAYKAKIEAQAEAVKAQAMTNDARAKQYVAQWEGYKAVVSAKGEVARTKLENQRQEVVAFQAEAAAKTAVYNAGVEFYKATSQISIANARGLTETAIKQAELTMNHGKTLANLHQANATVHANLAGAAMAGMNALAVESATTTE